ncbi:nitroreductase family protein [bacterium]|nr:nitroreductase family protein [bacterium]
MASKHTQAWNIDENEYSSLQDMGAKVAFLVRYAVLAPSPWNSQPWKFKVSGSRLELYDVPERLQEHRDHEGREHFVGCGAALANTAIAAAHFGLCATVRLCPPDMPPHCIGIMDFSERQTSKKAADSTAEQEADSLNERLFQAIPNRHSFRQDFLDRPIDESICQKMAKLAGELGVTFVPIADAGAKMALAGMVSEGDLQLGSNPATREEYANWIRANDNKGDGVPGYALGLDKWSALLAPVTHRLFDFTDENARHDSALTTDAPALCAVFMGREDNCKGWMKCGIALQRVLLLAASYGIQASFLNQIIPVPELRVRLSQLLGRSEVPQTVIRMGYPPQQSIKPTPRLPLSEVLM